MQPSPLVRPSSLKHLGALLVLLFAAVPAGCGHGSSSCVPGQSQKCAGEMGCSGYQVCSSDGTRFDDCICGDGGSHPFPETGQFSGKLGAYCVAASDCRNGLECITSSSNAIKGEGPSAGMCLQQCRVEHSTCVSVDATSQCISLDDAGTPDDPSDDLAYCLPGCKLGEQPATEDKCRGRADVVCTEYPSGANAGYCRPACRRDLDCAPRVCDLSTGLCADSPRSGAAIGENCSDNSACTGGCIDQGVSFSECSGVCSYDADGCNQGNNFPFDYFCSIAASAKAGSGDLGYCAKLCDCDDDCKRTDAVCEPHHDLIARAGRQGMCASKLTDAGAPRAGIACK
ncbi:MAG TPA: hypothetical protein VHU80_16915 [Polyangiaceae bacterium]|nr:hypothetical protein [Polyangiaceae bacterium]